MTDRPDVVIDGDGHVIEVNETYERIDPKYRERRPVYTQASKGYIVRLVDGIHDQAGTHAATSPRGIAPSRSMRA